MVVQDTFLCNGVPCLVTEFENRWVIWDYITKYDYVESYRAIILPKHLKKIDLAKFEYNTNLAYIQIAEDNPYFTTIDGVLYDKHVRKLILCPQAKEGKLTIPKTVKAINDRAFFNCHALTQIEVEEGNTVYHSENGNLFKGNTLIAMPITKDSGNNYLSIPTSAKSFAPLAFTNRNVKEITTRFNSQTNSSNEYYTNIDGVLYTQDRKTLVAYPGGKEDKYFTVPQHVTTIAPYAFYSNTHLQEITISENVKEIGECAFSNMDSLRIVYILSPRIQADKNLQFSEAHVYVTNEAYYTFYSKIKFGNILLLR